MGGWGSQDFAFLNKLPDDARVTSLWLHFYLCSTVLSRSWFSSIGKLSLSDLKGCVKAISISYKAWLGVFCSVLRGSIVLAQEFCFNLFFLKKPLLVIAKNSKCLILQMPTVAFSSTTVNFQDNLESTPLPQHKHVKLVKDF